MKKIKALIIEDEAPARELIKYMLKEHPEIEIAESAATDSAERGR